MSIAAIVTLGYGSYGSVKFIPTLGYSSGNTVRTTSSGVRRLAMYDMYHPQVMHERHLRDKKRRDEEEKLFLLLVSMVEDYL